MKHIDLFSGIGGFALAVDSVWDDVEHIFCDNDIFCQAVIKKHWPNSQIYGDIRTLTNTAVTDARRELRTIPYENVVKDRPKKQGKGQTRQPSGSNQSPFFILTGGFPCQPSSQAGRRKGTADERYLWPEMLRVIREFAPLWVIAENVRGLVTWNEGMVLEQVCSDLEAEGYEVQPIIIPAVAVGAPHRRDRVWIIAHRNDTGGRTLRDEALAHGSQNSKEREHSLSRSDGQDSNAPHPIGTRTRSVARTLANKRWETDEGRGTSIRQTHGAISTGRTSATGWSRNWLEVATRLCRVDDGLPAELDELKYSKPKHRAERLKSLGNAIVPQIAIQIMKAIRNATEPHKNSPVNYVPPPHLPPRFNSRRGTNYFSGYKSIC